MIGQGKFGTVWKAIYNKETVAVKIFDIHHKSSWQNEKHINSLDSTPHQDILPFIDSLTRGTGYNSQFFIITQYFPLGSLNQFLCHNTLSFEQAWNMMHSVSSGLSHLHSTSYSNSDGLILEKYAVVHRDVKTSNVLVKDECGHCVLGDLGLALILDPSFDDHQLANSGQVGTYRYMSPEALDARVNLRDIESFKQIDAYALTYVLWEVCTRLKIEGSMNLTHIGTCTYASIHAV
jgi:serine/threonine protein kinase